MQEHARRMYEEARGRIHDADILARSIDADSNSGTIIRILAFEVLLKCAIVLSGQTPKDSHNYKNHWLQLPGRAQKHVLQFAIAQMPGHTNFSELNKILAWYQFIFEKARYSYEMFAGYSYEDQKDLESLWLAEGARTEDALIQYYPLELDCLIEGLVDYIEPLIYQKP